MAGLPSSNAHWARTRCVWLLLLCTCAWTLLEPASAQSPSVLPAQSPTPLGYSLKDAPPLFAKSKPECVGKVLRNGKRFPWECTCEIELNLTLVPPSRPELTISHLRTVSVYFSVAMPRRVWVREYDAEPEPRVLLSERSMAAKGGATLAWSSVLTGVTSEAHNSSVDFGDVRCDLDAALEIAPSYDADALIPLSLSATIDFTGICYALSNPNNNFTYWTVEQEAPIPLAMSVAGAPVPVLAVVLLLLLAAHIY